MPGADTESGGSLCCGATQGNDGFAESIWQNFHIQPGNRIPKAGTQGFDNSFLGGKTAGDVRQWKFIFRQPGAFSNRKTAGEKGVTMLIEHGLDASHIYHINTTTDNRHKALHKTADKIAVIIQVCRLKNHYPCGASRGHIMRHAEKWAWGRWGAGCLRLQWVPPPEMPPDASQLIDRLWELESNKAAERGRVIFDGPVAALAGWEHREAALILKLYPAKYSEFQITCVRHADHFSDAHRRPAVGSSILLTQGRQNLLGLRSKSVASYPEHLHLFGGILTLAEGTTGVDVMHELQREMHEELRLSPADLVTAPLLCGILYEPNLHQPELVWAGNVRSGKAVELAANHEHSTLMRLTAADPVRDSHAWPPVTPVAQAALGLMHV